MHENALIWFKHEYRRLTLSSRCDVISDVIIMKNIFTHNLHMVFSFLISNWSYIELIKLFAKWRNFEVVANFFVKTVTGSMLYQPVSQWHSLHFELLIELVAQKLTELWWFKNLAYFFTWWPSSMTYLFVNVTYWNCSPILYVDQVWWWYVKAFMSYDWQNWQTNRQTNILAKL